MDRSNRYDWFKGKNQKDKKKEFKGNLKVTWKFTKAFLLFSLLFTSLWGCGQSFVIKSDSHVGRSLEFYRSENEVPPHVTEFSRINQGTTGHDIYSLIPQNENIWLKSKTHGSQSISDTVSEIENQGAKMSDAWKGVNEAVRVVDPNGDSLSSDEEILYTTITNKDGTTKKVPVVLSTASSEKPSYVVSQSINDVFTSNMGDFKWLWSENNAPKTTNFTWDSPVKSPNQGQEEIRTIFRSQLFESLNNIPNAPNWILDALTLKKAYDVTGLDLTKEPDREIFSKIQNAQINAKNVLNYLGMSIAGDSKGYKWVPAANDFMPGRGGAEYIPIVSWSQAWERGFGPFYGLFVYPVAQFQMAVTEAFPIMSGWEVLISMIIVIFVVRIFGFAISFRSTLQQTKMQELGLKKATIEAKYASYKNNKQMMQRKNQEIQDLYKKEGISPFSALTSIFVTMPIFLSIWRVIAAVPHIKSTNFLGINFSATSYSELFGGNVRYLPLMVVALGASLFSSFYPRLLVKKRDKLRGNAHLKKAMKKSDKIQIITTIIFAGISLIFSAGVQIYSIVVAVWTVIQTQITHEILKLQHRRARQKAIDK